ERTFERVLSQKTSVETTPQDMYMDLPDLENFDDRKFPPKVT
ncbi:29961_t:CDS:1, partial [Racocetra persica]